MDRLSLTCSKFAASPCCPLLGLASGKKMLELRPQEWQLLHVELTMWSGDISSCADCGDTNHLFLGQEYVACSWHECGEVKVLLKPADLKGLTGDMTPVRPSFVVCTPSGDTSLR